MTSLFEDLKSGLLDPQGQALADQLQWWALRGLQVGDPFPVAVVGTGRPLLLLHGFDSSFLEFRRLAPLLVDRFQLFIPDLFGFGFSPRPSDVQYGPEPVLKHLEQVLVQLPGESPVGVIGASMGGSVAVELARRQPERIGSLLLLAPAGLTGRPMPVPPLLDRLGAWFLSRPGVRRGLCRQAFADPDGQVGPPEEQIASLHLQCPGWAEALAAFARTGGFAGCGDPLPSQPLHVIWGANDRILRTPLKQAAQALLRNPVETFEACGHLPHIDQPQQVADRCLDHLLR
ncbi:MAG: alpha/beta hydrolase [Synechococcus sp. BS307-5m-G38]|nr:alpha/beta hydrolase [Synechococcus sp. BS307-5m-G38]